MAIFPETRHSIIGRLSSDDPVQRERAVEMVVSVYRAPIIALLQARLGLQTADAEDLAHDFLLQALTHEWLERYDARRAKFRTFLRTCVTAYASTAHESATRLKRGGHLRAVDLDLAAGLADDSSRELDSLFEQEWIRSVFRQALEAFRNYCSSAGRLASFEVFSAIDIEGAQSESKPTYAEVAKQLGIPATQVTNYLNWSRRRFRGHVIDTLRALTVDEAEFREEARILLGRELE